jgi:hypothetical protein
MDDRGHVGCLPSTLVFPASLKLCDSLHLAGVCSVDGDVVVWFDFDNLVVFVRVSRMFLKLINRDEAQNSSYSRRDPFCFLV